MQKYCVIAALFVAAACGNDKEPATGTGGTGGEVIGTGGTGGGAGEGGTGGGSTGGTGGTEVILDGPDSGWTPAPPDGLDGGLPEVARPSSCTSEHGFMSAIRGWVTAPGGTALERVKAQVCVQPAVGEWTCLVPKDTDAEG